MKQPAEIRLLNVGEVAKILGIHPVTVRKMLMARKLAYVKVGGATRIAESDIARFVEQRRVPAGGVSRISDV